MKARLLIPIGLIVLPMIVYGQVLRFEFVNYDDFECVTANPRMSQGLTRENVAWAFTTDLNNNWHPLTWLSLLLDATIHRHAGGRLNSGGFHLTSLLLHTTNVVLLYCALRMMTGAVWPSALAAALFAVHPLHVESVAWISERKDVLSQFFGLITLMAYVGWVRKRSWQLYAAALAMFILSLLSKPTLVTFPFLLLVLDWWPLGRWRCSADGPGALRHRATGALILEKVPFFLGSVTMSVVAIIAQGEAIATVDAFPLKVRLANAAIAYLKYLYKAVWPAKLAVFYPMPQEGINFLHAGLAATILLAITAGALLLWRRQPYLPVGWLWFLGTMVPMIGLVQLGQQQLADRYAYFPFVGLYVAVAWFAADVVRTFNRGRNAVAVLSLAAVAALAVVAHHQTSFWQNSVTLFRRATDVKSRSILAHVNLGNAYVISGRYANAVDQFEKALAIDARHVPAHINLGVAYATLGQMDQAVSHFQSAAEIEPSNAQAQFAFGKALVQREQYDKAIESYTRAIELNPGAPLYRLELAHLLLSLERQVEALDQIDRSLLLEPHNADLVQFAFEEHRKRGASLAAKGQAKEAVKHLRRAVELQPQSAEAHNQLGVLLLDERDREAAAEHFREAVRLNPDSAEARQNLNRAKNP